MSSIVIMKSKVCNRTCLMQLHEDYVSEFLQLFRHWSCSINLSLFVTVPPWPEDSTPRPEGQEHFPDG